MCQYSTRYLFRRYLDVFCRTLLGDPPARVEPITVRYQPGARAVRAKPRASPIVHILGDDNCLGDLLSRRVTRLGGGGLRAREFQVHEGAFRWERQVSDEGSCTRCVGGLCARRTHPRYGVGGGFAGFRTAAPSGAPWPPRDLSAGRGRLSEKATAGVYPLVGGRTPRGRCNDGSA